MKLPSGKEILKAQIDILTRENEALKTEVIDVLSDHRDAVNRYLKAEEGRARLHEPLQWLVKLKKSKDAHGKTAEYLEDQPHAWLAAQKALKEK